MPDSMRALILPCETLVREFDAKLLLALMAAARGITTVIGNKKTIDLNLTRYPAGVYVGKSVTARSRHNLELARACGHRVALWDEEGLVWASRAVYWSTKVDGATLNAPELLLAWGDENAAAWREHPDYRGTPIAVTGNPRSDLLAPTLRGYFDDEVAAIRARHGQFLLINTNFSRVNHVQPRQNRHLKWLREQRPDDPKGGFAAHKHALYLSFRAMLPQLAKSLAPVPILIRPHPSERVDTWREIARGLDNVAVDHTGNVAAWLLAANGLVHNGCTTAVEAYQLGRPALAYMPIRSSAYDHPFPNGVSQQIDDVEALVKAADSCVRDATGAFTEQATAARQQLMAQHLAGFGTESLAAGRVLDALAPLLSNPAPPPGTRRRTAAVALAARRAWRRLEHRVPGTPNYRPYLRHMFPDVAEADARRRGARLSHSLGLPDVPRIDAAPGNVFTVRPV
jgi:surface carbohydrate biosynthesis protein